MSSLQNQWFAMGSNSPSYELQGKTYAELTVNGNSVKSVELISNNFITLNSSTSVVPTANKTGSYITIINPVVGHKLYAKITTSNPNLRLCWYKSGTTAYDFVTGEFLDSSSTVSNVFEGVYTVTQDMVYSDGYMQFYYWIYNGLPTGNHTLTVQLIDLTELGMDSIINPVLFNATELGKLMSKRLVEFGSKIYSNGEYKVNQLVNKNHFPSTTTTNGITFTNNNDGTITCNGTATNNAFYSIQSASDFNATTIGHKYLLIGCPIGGSNATYSLFYNTNGLGETGNGKIVRRNAEGYDRQLSIRIGKDITVNNLTFRPQLVDLTDLYGVGNEPTTVEQFLTDYPMYNNYVEYAPIGTVRNGICLSNGNILPLSEPLRSVGDLKDSYSTSGKEIRKFAEVDLGSLEWQFEVSGGANIFYATNQLPLMKDTTKLILCSKYITSNKLYPFEDKVIYTTALHRYNEININESSYNDPTIFKTAMQGVKLIYELATPTETTTDRLVLPTDTTILNAEYNKELKSVEFPVYTKKSELPYEYQEVEYLESTGTQWIDTEYIPNHSTKFSIKNAILFDSTSSKLAGHGLGSGYGNSRCIIGTSGQGNNIVYYGIYYNNYEGLNTTFQYEKDVPFIASIDLSKPSYSFNGVEKIVTATTSTATDSMYLFARHQSSAVTRDMLNPQRLYWAKMEENNALVRNFIPCYRKADNVAGMYDLVNGQFYTNQGTGEFIVGNDVNTDIEIAPKRRTKNLINIEDFSLSTTDRKIDTSFNNTYTFSCEIYSPNNTATGGASVVQLTIDGTVQYIIISRDALTGYYRVTKTFSGNLSRIRFTNFGVPSGENIYFRDIQLEEGSTATAYEPYYDYLTELKRVGNIKDTYTTLNGIDMNRLGVVDLGELSYQFDNSGRIYTVISKAKLQGLLNGLMSKYKFSANAYYQTEDKTWYGYNGTLYIYDTNYTTPSALKTSLQGVKLIYELAEPTKTKYSSTKLPRNITKFVDKNGVEVEYIRKK